MLPSNNGMIRNCAASPSSSLGRATVLSSAPLRTRPEPSVSLSHARRASRTSVPGCGLCRTGFHTLPGGLAQRPEIFQRHTDLIEPLSLDEAYLDVTENKTSLPTATLVARAIREQIRQELSLTASAGVAPNKFLAKIASDWRKPDGLFVIQPEKVEAFLQPLPVGRLPGVGKVTGEKSPRSEYRP